MAQAIARQLLDQSHRDDVEVSSAGTAAWDGAPASEGAYLVALEHNVDLSAHRAVAARGRSLRHSEGPVDLAW